MQGIDNQHSSGFSPQPTPPRRSWQRPQQPASKPKRDPAPSRLAYRLQRMWLTPFFRRLTRVGLPVFTITVVALLWISDEDRRASLSGALTGMVEAVQNRDEFMVKMMTIDGASEPIDKALRMMLPVNLPASSFDIDLDQLRQDILLLDAIKDVDLRIKPNGILKAVVVERKPVMLWRHARGIEMIDETGRRVASVTARSARPDLPLIAGEGADKASREAVQLFAAAGPLLPRIRGLQRVGERRWDVVLDENQRIMLPEEGAAAALERIIALDKAEDLLKRDILLVDLRDGSRAIARIGVAARNRIRAVRGKPLLGPDGRELRQNNDNG